MIRLRSLRSRITVLFVGSGLLLSTVFAVAAIMASNAIEMRFVADTLGEELKSYIQRVLSDQDATTLPHGLQGFVTPAGTTDRLPPYLHDRTPGIYEQYLGDKEYHIAVKDYEGRRFYLVHDATSIEHWEGYLYRLLITGIALFGLLGLAVGMWISHRLVAPVIRLANRIESLCPESPDASELARGHARDEVGYLAEAFEQYCQRIGAFILREQEFTANVSHELRTPLAVIRSTIELLQSQAGSNERLVASLERVQRAASQMSALMDAFLLLARESQARKAEVTTAHALEPVLLEVLDNRQPELAQRGIGLHVAVHGSPKAQAPRAVLNVVISNLVGNAIAYTREGRIEVTLTEHSVTVADTGPGIPLRDQAHIYERGFRGNQQDSGGAGLGLQIVKRLCERYGCRIQVDSTEGAGTTAVVTFSS